MKKQVKKGSDHQEAIRKQIASSKPATGVLRLIKQLEEVYAETAKYDDGLSKELQAKYLTQIAAIKTGIDARLRLLNKVLPDARVADLRVEEQSVPQLKVILGSRQQTTERDKE